MKRALKITGIVIAVLIVLLIALPFLINVNMFRPQIESQLSNALGRKVTVGNLSLSPLRRSVEADNIAIADDPSFSNSPFIRAQRLDVGVKVLPLIFSKALHVTDITLSRPQVSLIADRSKNRWNFSSLGNASPARKSGTPPPSSQAQAPAAPPSQAGRQNPAPGENPQPTPNQAQPGSASALEQNLSVGRLAIRGGEISVATTASRTRPRVYKNVDLTVTNFSFSSQSPFTLSADTPGGGNMKLAGTAGPVNPNDAAMTPLEAKIDVNGGDIAASGFVDPGSGIAGIANFSGTIHSDGTRAQSNGDATIDRLKLSPKGSPAQRPVAMKYQTTYDMPKQTGQLNGDVTIGKAVARLSGAFDLHGDSAALNMKLHADNMPVDDLQTMMPALGVTLPAGSSLQGGTLSADLTVTGPVNQLAVNGPVKLANTKLHGFDMGSKMAAISAFTGLKTGPDTMIQNLSTNMRVAPAGIQTDNVNLVVPTIGTVTGNGTVSAQNALNYRMQASLSGTTVSQLSQLARLGGRGATIPFFVQGTSSQPKFVPDVKGMLNTGLGKNLGSQIPGGQNAQGAVNAITGLFSKKKPK
ncbi:MAG: AsmA family protein [Acidobacteria bacterium]|nr:AsmA family protein [Acidobacteriota bacterium]